MVYHFIRLYLSPVAGEVECDASIMEGSSLAFGAVGAVSGVRNPIELARGVLERQKQPLPGGLVPPRFVSPWNFHLRYP